MARKIEATDSRIRPETKPDDGAADLDVLHPDRVITIAGHEVTVREYSFVEGLRIRAGAKNFLADLHKQIQTGDMLTEDILDVLAVHSDLVLSLLAKSTGMEPEWLKDLNDVDGDLLLLTWWGVCGPFFVRPIARRLGQELLIKVAASGGRTSTPPSPLPGSAASSSSTNTPNGN
ncbi:DUF6631 family protein [Rhodanobacter lindaniclasticus]